MTEAQDESAQPAANPLTGRRLDATGRASLVAALALLVVSAFQLEVLAPDTLVYDPGIRVFLSKLTAEGALPLRDFEHGWNAGGWYVGAALWQLVGHNPGLWHWVFVSLIGTAGTGLLQVSVLRRAGVPAAAVWAWLAGFLVVLSVPNGKYVIPSIWVWVLVRRRSHDRLSGDLVAGAVLGATVLLHVDLAMILVAGAGAHELLVRRDATTGTRLLRAVAPAVSAVAFLALELLWFDLRHGVDPGWLVDFLLLDRSGTIEGINFGYPLLAPPFLLAWVWPVSLVAPALPAVWTRLSPATRLVFTLHLAMSLTAIRKADPPHVNAAATLVVLLVVLVAVDLRRDPVRLRGSFRAPAVGLGNLALLGSALAVGFLWASLAAWPVCVVLVLAAARLGERLDDPPALAATRVGLTLIVVWLSVGFVGHLVTATTGDHDPAARQLAAELRRQGIEECLPPSRQALVVRQPLGLYDELDLTNPTPFYLFWEGFNAEADRVGQLMDTGRLPVVIQIGRWAPGWRNLIGKTEADYDVCLSVVRPGADDVVVWTHRG